MMLICSVYHILSGAFTSPQLEFMILLAMKLKDSPLGTDWSWCWPGTMDFFRGSRKAVLLTFGYSHKHCRLLLHSWVSDEVLARRQDLKMSRLALPTLPFSSSYELSITLKYASQTKSFPSILFPRHFLLLSHWHHAFLFYVSNIVSAFQKWTGTRVAKCEIQTLVLLGTPWRYFSHLWS